MPCNLAVTITKAAVTDEALLGLLTSEGLMTVLRAFLEASDYTVETLQDYFYRGHFSATKEAGVVGVVVDAQGLRYTVAIDRGKVQVSGPQGTTAQVAALQEAVGTLVSRYAAQLFAEQVQAAIAARLGAQVASQQVEVENEGQTAIATVLSFTL